MLCFKARLSAKRLATCASPIMHHVPSPTPPPKKNWITFVFHFSWVLQPSQEKLKTMIVQNVGGRRGGGRGANRVYYGRCANGKLINLFFFFFFFVLLHPLMTSKREAVTSISALKSVFAIRSPRSQRCNHHLLTVPVIDTKRTE